MREFILNELTNSMIDYYAGDPKRIQHFIKVHSFAKLIGEGEHIDKETLFTLEAAALVHDIGIKIAEEKYNSTGGKLQEKEGVAPARKMLQELSFPEKIIDRVCYLVAHHHTYKDIDGIDYQILIEADFLVNMYEDNCKKEVLQSALEHIFRTKTGIDIYKTMFNLKEVSVIF